MVGRNDEKFCESSNILNEEVILFNLLKII